MDTISRNDLKASIENGGDMALVEVLPPESFEEAHLPGAINVPLDADFERNIQAVLPNKSEPVVAYCSSNECTASPKAAKKMEHLGYDKVAHYKGGKADWQRAGLRLVSSA